MDPVIRSREIDAVIFDWGNTLMVDFGLEGPMCDWPRVEAVEGAREVLEALSKRYPLFVATNGGSSGAREVMAALDRVGLGGFFKAVYAQKDLGFGKPDNRFFAAICRREGLAPSRCLMVGDHIEKDVRGALAFGMQAVLFDPRESHPGFEGKRIVSLRELAALV
ncbi:MAG TPA: HAD family hydrolase [Candidatus Mcinerneyibacteriales bacterium]|nr:HAD family hydrolase [Candidatus Mcinerneyibacteriales bacterium]HPJ69699.1 HAD family hydrolase [Candidatus Mcinerneyibacteriales bacterium]HPQ89442.1 HAD family hydrolase [Candidatus Mcinerneyibacteriales bacterium]